MADSEHVRSDGALFTAMHSRSFTTEKTKRRQARAKKLAVKSKLTPAAKIVGNQIAALRAEIAEELGNLIHVDMRKTDVKSVVLGLRLADKKMLKLKSQINTALRVTEPIKEDDDDQSV